jgi:uncharacterized protein DUF2612
MVNTGPPVPHPNPAPGSNGIGTFTIGVSPIGTIEAFDFWVTVISQYANSPILTGMIQSFNEAMDLTEDFDDFYDMIWNVLTAQGYGLDVWGRIVDVARTIPLTGNIAYLGFDEASSWTGFGQGGFYTGGGISPNFVLGDADYRRLILAKAASNICDGSIEAINKILLALFPQRGACYVADGLNMSLTYTFSFALNPVEIAIVEDAGVLPNPTGVVVNISAPS